MSINKILTYFNSTNNCAPVEEQAKFSITKNITSQKTKQCTEEYFFKERKDEKNLNLKKEKVNGLIPQSLDTGKFKLNNTLFFKLPSKSLSNKDKIELFGRNNEIVFRKDDKILIHEEKRKSVDEERSNNKDRKLYLYDSNGTAHGYSATEIVYISDKEYQSYLNALKRSIQKQDKAVAKESEEEKWYTKRPVFKLLQKLRSNRLEKKEELDNPLIESELSLLFRHLKFLTNKMWVISALEKEIQHKNERKKESDAQKIQDEEEVRAYKKAESNRQEILRTSPDIQVTDSLAGPRKNQLKEPLVKEAAIEETKDVKLESTEILLTIKKNNIVSEGKYKVSVPSHTHKDAVSHDADNELIQNNRIQNHLHSQAPQAP